MAAWLSSGCYILCFLVCLLQCYSISWPHFPRQLSCPRREFFRVQVQSLGLNIGLLLCLIAPGKRPACWTKWTTTLLITKALHIRLTEFQLINRDEGVAIPECWQPVLADSFLWTMFENLVTKPRISNDRVVPSLAVSECPLCCSLPVWSWSIVVIHTRKMWSWT